MRRVCFFFHCVHNAEICTSELTMKKKNYQSKTSTTYNYALHVNFLFCAVNLNEERRKKITQFEKYMYIVRAIFTFDFSFIRNSILHNKTKNCYQTKKN